MNEFRTVRVTRLIRSNKSEYYINLFNTNRNTCDLWRHVRRLGIAKPKIIPPLVTDIDSLNRHFTDTSSEPRSAIVVPDNLPFDDSRFFFSHITADDIIKSVSRSGSEAVRVDNIPVSFIKMTLPYTLPIVLHLFDPSLQQSYFPSTWKQSIIRPIPKIASLVPNDYRPISLLCSLSKVLERVVHRQISGYLKMNGLLDPYQPGFRTHHSTQTALLKVFETIRWEMDQGRVTLLVLFDLSRAFDCVDHALLISKLERFNFLDGSYRMA